MAAIVSLKVKSGMNSQTKTQTSFLLHNLGLSTSTRRIVTILLEREKCVAGD